jgi:ATP-dependent Clp protease ATP-binding subunit ClpC
VFVDPDEPAAAGPSLAEAVEEPESVPSLQAIVLRPRGTPAELGCLGSRLERLLETVERESWHERKLELMSRMSEPGFWNSSERFVVLGEVEYLDRIESSLDGSRSLLARLGETSSERRSSYPRDLIRTAAQQLYLLEIATDDVRESRPRDAFVEVDAGYGAGGSTRQRDAFAERIGRMYRDWSSRRGMQLQVLEETGGDGRRPYRLLLAVSGYGAYSILNAEDGLHVHEIPEGRRARSFRKCAIHVRVVPQPEIPPVARDDRRPIIALRAQALEALELRDRDTLTIVRRYRDRPSPLVRDDVRGWRSGLIDDVLKGNFDVMTDSASAS